MSEEINRILERIKTLSKEELAKKTSYYLALNVFYIAQLMTFSSKPEKLMLDSIKIFKETVIERYKKIKTESFKKE